MSETEQETTAATESPAPEIEETTTAATTTEEETATTSAGKKMSSDGDESDDENGGDDASDTASDTDNTHNTANSKVRMQAHLILAKVNRAEKASGRKSIDGEEEEAKAASKSAAEAEADLETARIASEAVAVAKSKREKENLKKKSESTEELSKRLQKIALDRQKEGRQERLRVIQNDENSHLHSAKTFQELKLPPHLLKALFEMGFERPSAIQEEALPRILASPPRNVIGQAQSGSGKTAAFVLGMLFRMDIDSPATTQALCVTPTRELAVQIFEKAVTPMAAHMAGLKVQLALAGETMERGKKLDAHMVVGTPGKVVDWLKRRTIDAKRIKVFVLDEADNMVAESGHRANSLLIKKQMPKKCQSLLFSATFTSEVIGFAEKMVYNPDKILIESGPEFLVLDVIKQLWIDCQTYDGGRLQFLEDIYSLLTIGQSIVFVGSKRDADDVHRTLTDSGYTCSLLHGGVDNDERDRTMAAFRANESDRKSVV